MNEKTFVVPNISCGHCALAIKNELGDQPGIDVVDIDSATKQVTVRWDDPASWDGIVESLKEIGYPPAA